jgi:hypothetical protein
MNGDISKADDIAPFNFGVSGSKFEGKPGSGFSNDG